MKVFANAFQIFVRQDLPVYLIMTGLYENIYELQNQKSLTFLYRAPKIQLQPLNIGTMTENYQKVFELIKKLQTDIYADTMYPNDLRPQENRGYSTEYKGL